MRNSLKTLVTHSVRSFTHGPFRLKKLADVSDIELLVNSTIHKCNDLVSECLQQEPTRKSIQLLDQVSNCICCAIDPLTAISRLHNEQTFQKEAINGTMTLQQYMDVLNHNPKIFELLQSIENNENLWKSLNAEERQIVSSSIVELKLTTSIHLSDEQRNEIQNLRQFVVYKEDEFYRLCHDIEEQPMSANDEQSEIIVNRNNFGLAMRNWKSQNDRKQMFDAFYSNHDIRFGVLQTLRDARHSFATQLGYTSFAELKAQTSLLGNLDDIELYLLNLMHSVSNDCKNEIEQLKQIENSNSIQLSDLTYLTCLSQQNDSNHASKTNVQSLESFLTLENVQQSLQRILSIFFDLEMDKVAIDDGESWLVDNALKYEFRKPITNELIAILYLDLFERENKQFESVTYPLCCSCKIDYNRDSDHLGFANPNDKNKQIPMAVISCNFSANSEHISHEELTTLYHEFGHSLHYLLSDTEYQTFSGSRGLCMEYLEFVSTLFERFASDELFMKYVLMDGNCDNIPIPNKSSPMNSIKNIHLMQQICDALMDLSLFGDENKQSMSIAEIVENVYKPFVELMNSDDIGYNSHLLRASRFYHYVDYPANYYSYIIAEKISKQVWNSTFGNDKQSREFQDWKTQSRDHGRRLNESLLRYGSAKNPLSCINDFCEMPDVTKLDCTKTFA